MSAQYFTTFKLAKRAEAMGKAFLRREVHDPALREKLTPRYAAGCKRPRFPNTYLATYNRDNVDLVTDPIDKITPLRVCHRRGTDPGDWVMVMDVDSLTPTRSPAAAA